MITTLLAQANNQTQQIFGTVKPPVGGNLADPGAGLSKLISTGIQIAIFIASFLLLGYLFYGAFLYITSAGDEEKAQTARNTITYAVIGIILLFVGLSVFVVVAGDMLKIIRRDKGGNIYFDLPTVGN